MELPIELRAAIETEAACVPQSQLRLMADSLSRRYREDARDGHSMLSRSARRDCLRRGAYARHVLRSTHGA